MKSVKRITNKILDIYIIVPMVFDGLILLVIWFCPTRLYLFSYSLKDKGNQLNLISNLIGTGVSLAGFILAALTIIVTFKASLKVKGIEDSENALELIFSTKHYSAIVDVFKKAIGEFIFCFLFLYFFWIGSDAFSLATLHKAVLSGVTIIALTASRSVFLLFMVLNLERYKKPGEEIHE